MSYQLTENESIGDGIRRIICEQIERGIEAAGNSKDGENSPVHQTRKHLKKSRAALRLIAAAVPKERFKREQRNLRNVGRLISGIRDAEVRLATVKQLEELSRSRDNPNFQETQELLSFELDSFLAAFSDWQEEAKGKLQRSRDRISSWPIEGVDCERICRAVQHSYKSGRQALRHACGTKKERDFHEFRKQVKQLWYQLRILRRLHPLILNELSDELKTISDHLGHSHDLSFLMQRLSLLPSGRKRGQRVLVHVIQARGKELQRTAAALGERFYAQRPRQFARRIAEYFLEWEIARLRNTNTVALENAA